MQGSGNFNENIFKQRWCALKNKKNKKYLDNSNKKFYKWIDNCKPECLMSEAQAKEELRMILNSTLEGDFCLEPVEVQRGYL